MMATKQARVLDDVARMVREVIGEAWAEDVAIGMDLGNDPLSIVFLELELRSRDEKRAKAVPRERVNVLRAAFQAALNDEAFTAEAQAQSLPLDPVPGEEAAAIINKIYSAPPELARKVKDVLE